MYAEDWGFRSDAPAGFFPNLDRRSVTGLARRAPSRAW
jgi:hypothetical protein